MQNEPNFVRGTTNATLSTACHSDRRHACSVPKRRNLLQHSHYLPNPLLHPACHTIVTCIMQNKPNFPAAEIALNLCPEKHYGKTSFLRPRQNKPNQTQFRPTDTQSGPERSRRDDIRDTPALRACEKIQSVLDSGLGVLDKLQDGGIREVMSTEDTIQPSLRNANEARLFAVEASESQEAEPVGRPRLRRAPLEIPPHGHHPPPEDF